VARFTLQLSNGTTEEVSIPGSEELSKQQVDELLAWSKENSERRAKIQAQKKQYKRMPEVDAYREMAKFKIWLEEGIGKVY